MSNVVGNKDLNIEITHSDQLLETKTLLDRLQYEHDRFIQNKIIYEALQECVGDKSELRSCLKQKIKNIMQDVSCVQISVLDDYSDLFGLTDSKTELTYAESNELGYFLKRELDKNSDILKNDVEMDNSDFDEFTLSSWKMKLTAEQDLYVKNLLTLQELLEEIKTLRTGELPSVLNEKIKETTLQSRINYIKSLLVQQKIRVDTFMETTGSLHAYKELIKDIKEEIEQCKKDLQNLHELRQKYKQVSCKQYDDLLKSYKQYKAALEKKKLISETLCD